VYNAWEPLPEDMTADFYTIQNIEHKDVARINSQLIIEYTQQLEMMKYAFNQCYDTHSQDRKEINILFNLFINEPNTFKHLQSERLVVLKGVNHLNLTIPELTSKSFGIQNYISTFCSNIGILNTYDVGHEFSKDIFKQFVTSNKMILKHFRRMSTMLGIRMNNKMNLNSTRAVKGWMNRVLKEYSITEIVGVYKAKRIQYYTIQIRDEWKYLKLQCLKFQKD